MPTLKSLSQVRSAGGIVSREPIKVSGTWKHIGPDGEEIEDTFEVGVVKVSFGDMADLFKEKDREQLAVSLSKSVMFANDKGKLELLSYEDAYRLDPGLGTVLIELVRKVNGGDRKNSTPPTNSSASSSSQESEVAPSKAPDNN